MTRVARALGMFTSWPSMAMTRRPDLYRQSSKTFRCGTSGAYYNTAPIAGDRCQSTNRRTASVFFRKNAVRREATGTQI